MSAKNFITPQCMNVIFKELAFESVDNTNLKEKNFILKIFQ
jgi:hypothetical protein